MLHIINKATPDASLEQCRALIDPQQDAVLLMADGVLSALASYAYWPPSLAVFALSRDIEARAINAYLAPHIQIIDDAGFVTLTEQHAQSISW